MSRCVIVGGGEMKSPVLLCSLIEPSDFIIAADGGLQHIQTMGLAPDLVVGDFDSYTGEVPKEVECIALPREKDDTDMLYAVRQGLSRGYRDFLLLGAMGGRLDHTLANLGVLRFLSKQGCRGCMADADCQVQVVSQGEITLERDERFAYLSIFALDGDALGVTLQGVRYPLSDARLTGDYPIGCSNEIIDSVARVAVRQGAVVVLRCAGEG